MGRIKKREEVKKMTKFKRQLFSVITAGTMLLSIATPAIAETTIQITGNGSGANNLVDVSQEQSTTVVQNNDADITNTVDVDADTGNNDANFNTGGDTTVLTGNSNVDVNVENILNKNVANAECCEPGDVNVLIEKNGANPYEDQRDPKDPNTVLLEMETETSIFQDNRAKVNNDVDVDAETGENDANYNTGGEVTVLTGKADVDVNLSTAANLNVAEVSGSAEKSVSAQIVENGAGSNNLIDLDFETENLISQTNWADVRNHVDVDAETGENEAKFNTGGDVTIWTGDATVDVEVENLLNFNHAVLDCGCALDDLFTKIDHNGAYSRNTILMDFDFNEDDEETGTFQTNRVRLNNDLRDLDAETGENDANFNGGDAGDDPAVITGNSDVEVDVVNTVNANVSGEDSWEPWNIPGAHVSLTLDLGELLAYLGLA